MEKLTLGESFIHSCLTFRNRKFDQRDLLSARSSNTAEPLDIGTFVRCPRVSSHMSNIRRWLRQRILSGMGFRSRRVYTTHVIFVFIQDYFPDDPETQERFPTKSYDPEAPRPALGEAHGGYTFCATASWVILQPFINIQRSVPVPNIDTHALLRWCVQMQGQPIELGGFKGRTNKLVDGCYSWWVGGCVVLVETLLGTASRPEAPFDAQTNDTEEEKEAWDDADGKIALPKFCPLRTETPLTPPAQCTPFRQTLYSTGKLFKNTFYALVSIRPVVCGISPQSKVPYSRRLSYRI